MKKIFTLFAIFLICSCSYAQSNITMELKDAPVRTSLEMIFKQAGIKSYVIENSVAGFISMNLTDQPFENALKLVMRANSIPLTYTKENDVYIVKQRISTPPILTGGPDPIPAKNNSLSWQVINLNHIDPFDLQSVLGNILFINQGTRSRGNNGIGMGFGGGNNNSSGLGSFGGNFGGQMGNGNSTGGMGSFSFGTNGGFGGGRNF